MTARELGRGLSGRLGLLAAGHLSQHLLFLSSWGVLGRAVLGGQVTTAMIAGWALLLASSALVRVGCDWLKGRIAIEAGSRLRQRFFEAAVSAPVDELRRRGGVARFADRVLEGSSADALGLNAALDAGLCAIDVVLAASLLGVGAGGLLHAALFVSWVGVVCAVALIGSRQQRNVTQLRSDLSAGIVERVSTSLTRAVQLAPGHADPHEQRAIDEYDESSTRMDRVQLVMSAISRAWVVVGLVGVLPAFFAGSIGAPLAIAVGGIMVGGRAIGRASGCVPALIGGLGLWREIAPLLRRAATSRIAPESSPASLAEVQPLGDRTLIHDPTVLFARNVTFRHDGREEAVLRGVSMKIRMGERIVIDGASGSGKSTLAAILAGARPAEAGVLLLDGAESESMPSARSNAIAVPAPREGSLVPTSLARNLLLGRAWPPSPQDVTKAMAVCAGLGLRPLIERMPHGMFERVGDGGWKLSDGEKARVYLARAMLADPDLLVVDECFELLDADTLLRTMRFVMSRSATLVVTGHR